MKKTKNYIDNKRFYEEILKHNAKVKKHIEEKRNSEPPRIPDYVGECFMKISEHIARRPNFSGYTFKDEMIEDGIENCIMAYNSFNPEKYDKPFSYFSKIIWFAFLRRIEKEAKQSYVKHMSLVNMSIDMMVSGSNENITIDDEKASSYVNKFEKKKAASKIKSNMKKKIGIEKFIE